MPQHAQRSFDGDLTVLSGIRHWATDFFAGADPRAVSQFVLALDELNSNVIRHAFKQKEGADNTISVELDFQPNKLSATLCYIGPDFDLSTFPDVSIEELAARGARGGMGIAIIRKMVNKVSYRRSHGLVRCRLEKNLPITA